MSDYESEARRLRMALGEAQGKNDRLQREVNELKRQAGKDGRKIEGLTGAANELLGTLDRFLDEETACVYELRTGISLLRGAL